MSENPIDCWADVAAAYGIAGSRKHLQPSSQPLGHPSFVEIQTLWALNIIHCFFCNLGT